MKSADEKVSAKRLRHDMFGLGVVVAAGAGEFCGQ